MSKAPLSPAELGRLDSTQREAESGTLYGLLGLDTRAAREDVETAYRDYVRDWHPDRFFSRDAGTKVEQIENNFVEVTRAYKTLRDANKRTVYDADLRGRGVTVVAVGGGVRDERVGFEVRVDRPSGGSTRIAPAALSPAAPPQAPSAPAASAPPAVTRLQGQMAEQFARARTYFDAGVVDLGEGRFAKAESSFYLAMRYDPRNQEYAEKFRLAQTGAKRGRAAGFIGLGQTAEQFGNAREALVQYRKAVECDPEEGVAYAKLAMLLRQVEKDSREALTLLRKAVQKEPKQVAYRIALAELYVELKLLQNAGREVQAALQIDPTHARALALRKQLRFS